MCAIVCQLNFERPIRTTSGRLNCLVARLAIVLYLGYVHSVCVHSVRRSIMLISNVFISASGEDRSLNAVGIFMGGHFSALLASFDAGTTNTIKPQDSPVKFNEHGIKNAKFY